MFFIFKYLKRRFKKSREFLLLLFIITVLSVLLIYCFKKRQFNEINNETTLRTDYQLKRVPRYKSLVKPDDFKCVNVNTHQNNVLPSNEDTKPNKEIVILTDTVYNTNLVKNLTKIFIQLKFNFKREYYQNINQLNNQTGLIIFENYELYLRLRQNNENFLNYLANHQTGIIIFNTIKNTTTIKIKNCKLHNSKFVKNSFLNLTKFNKASLEVNQEFSYNFDFKGFFTAPDNNNSNQRKSVLVCDQIHNLLFVNNFNSVRHVFISFDNLNHLWLLKLLFIDAIRYASNNQIAVRSYKRHVQIDIDDVFVGSSGTRMLTEDVNELIRLQNVLSMEYFKSNKFKFNLGYSGFYYKSGQDEENEADELLVKNKEKFNWFDHTWAHLKPHLMNETFMKDQFIENLNFAKLHKIPIDSGYSVSPHHSGIYPVFSKLYNAWSDILSVKATSTETYPHQNPMHLRRGFIFNGTMVAPRQSCGVYTHTLYFDMYTGGLKNFISNYQGGILFESLVYNQVNIFMTHMVNYANDRLAVYLFENVFKLLSCWTNLQFMPLPPIDLVGKYFELNDQDREPLWTNVCDDHRHVAIWHRNATECNRLPKFVIIGPQKTGTTALHAFLKIHPELRTSRPTVHFEETQFFTDNNYFKGLDWYLDLFELPEQFYNYEKSANYFDDPKAPKRIRALMKDAKLVVFLMNPIDRAYSWYQHIKAHNDTTAIKHSFYEILQANETNTAAFKLKERCLDPGVYYKHLKNWFKEFLPKQFFLIDSNLFKTEPFTYLNQLQNFFGLKKQIDYKNELVFNEKKKFFCLKHKCLGASKGRKYPSMDENSFNYLKNFYSEANKKLRVLLTRNEFSIPSWLDAQ